MDFILLSDSLWKHEYIETYAKLRSSPARKKLWGSGSMMLDAARFGRE